MKPHVHASIRSPITAPSVNSAWGRSPRLDTAFRLASTGTAVGRELHAAILSTFNASRISSSVPRCVSICFRASLISGAEYPRYRNPPRTSASLAGSRIGEAAFLAIGMGSLGAACRAGNFRSSRASRRPTRRPAAARDRQDHWGTATASPAPPSPRAISVVPYPPNRWIAARATHRPTMPDLLAPSRNNAARKSA